MALQFENLSTSATYTCPDCFYAQVVERRANAEGYKVEGVDGRTYDPNAVSFDEMRVEIHGYIDGTKSGGEQTAANIDSEYSSLNSFLNGATDDEIQITGFPESRSVTCRTQSERIRFIPGLLLDIRLSLVAPSGDWD